MYIIIVKEYNEIKLRDAVEGPEEYWKAKDAFFAKLLAKRGR